VRLQAEAISPINPISIILTHLPRSIVSGKFWIGDSCDVNILRNYSAGKVLIMGIAIHRIFTFLLMAVGVAFWALLIFALVYIILLLRRLVLAVEKIAARLQKPVPQSE
jgi:hypothetical protein